jgi:hypothetical protein
MTGLNNAKKCMGLQSHAIGEKIYDFFSEVLVDFVGAEPYLPLIKQTYRQLVARVTASLF